MIQLYIGMPGECGGTWIADHMGDLRVLDLFGTTIIPTAFTSAASPEFVRDQIQYLNPKKMVVLR